MVSLILIHIAKPIRIWELANPIILYFSVLANNFTKSPMLIRFCCLFRHDSDGFLTITGRIKELIITAGGENISPIAIEDNIRNELPEVVSNVMAVGDRRKYLTCLVTLKVCRFRKEVAL